MEYNLLDIVWTMIAACLVYFMQAGFAMVETGFTRAKNAGNIVMKNMMDFVIGSIAFFLVGFGLMFGQGNGFIGLSGFFNPYGLQSSLQEGIGLALPIGVFMIFHTVFCATSATIVSGAMAERTKFAAYLAYSACISILSILSQATGFGAAAGYPLSDSTTLPVPQPYILSEAGAL